jgi:hypothetical protein
MKENRKDSPGRNGYPYVPLPRNAITRLLLIPFLVYLIWVLETFLFEGNVHLFLQPEPVGLLLYTVVTCIFIGLLVPVFLMCRTFMSGAVNMFQFGFRSLRRTTLAVALTTLVVCAAVALQNPFGTDRSAFAAAFLLLLPTGIASVMICWVLVGTHVQALVRDGGVLMSISTGVVVTAILFGLTSLVLFPGAGSQDTLFWYIFAGILTAIFFFSVRDVWAASVAVTGELVYLLAGRFDTAMLHQAFPGISLAAVITMGGLAVIHWHLSRNYVTIPVLSA